MPDPAAPRARLIGVRDRIAHTADRAGRDPASIRLEEWTNRESEGVLVVPRAGEFLYRIRK